jgi:hypothetical protein
MGQVRVASNCVKAGDAGSSHNKSPTVQQLLLLGYAGSTPGVVGICMHACSPVLFVGYRGGGPPPADHTRHNQVNLTVTRVRGRASPMLASSTPACCCKAGPLTSSVFPGLMSPCSSAAVIMLYAMRSLTLWGGRHSRQQDQPQRQHAIVAGC